MKKQIIALFLVVCTLILVSCNNNPPNATKTTLETTSYNLSTTSPKENEKTTGESISTTEIIATTNNNIPVIVEDFISLEDYNIVYNYMNRLGEKEIAEELHNYLLNAYHVDLPIYSSFHIGDIGHEVREKEILIGQTDRIESTSITDTWNIIPEEDYICKAVLDKVIIMSENKEMLKKAFYELIHNFNNKSHPYIKKDMDSSHLHIWPLSDVLICDNSIFDFEIVFDNDPSKIVLFAVDYLNLFLKEKTNKTLSIEGNLKEYKIHIGAPIPKDTEFNGSSEYAFWIYFRDKDLYIGGKNDIAICSAIAYIKNESNKIEYGKEYSVKEIGFDINSITDDLVVEGIKITSEYRKNEGIKEISSIVENSKDTKVDIYNGYASALLSVDKSKLSSSLIEKANLLVRNSCGSIPEAGSSWEFVPDDAEKIEGHTFVAARVVRLLFGNGWDNIEEETKNTLFEFFTKKNICSVYYSENLMLMFRASRYLAACKYEEEFFPIYGKYGSELRKEDHDYLINYLSRIGKYGWVEFDSFRYLETDFVILSSLLDFAPDEDIRTIAEMSMSSIFLTLLMDGTENYQFGGAHARIYSAAYYDMHTSMAFLCDLYFGEGNVLSEKGGVNSSITPMLYCSNYVPNSMIYKLALGKEYPIENIETTSHPFKKYDIPNYSVGTLSKYTYSTRLYSIGSVNHQEEALRNYMKDDQITSWCLAFANNPNATIFTHHPATEFNNGNVLGNKRAHDYWFGDASCNCNHLFSNQSTVLGFYYINLKQEKLWIHAHIAKKQFDEIIEDTENNRMFLKLGDAYAMLMFSHEYMWNEKVPDEIIIKRAELGNARLAFACEAGDKDTYSSFENFISEMKKKEFRFDYDNMTVSFGNMTLDLDIVDGEVKESHYIDGIKQNYPYTKTYSNKYVYSEYGSGIITVKFDSSIWTMDFNKVVQSFE